MVERLTGLVIITLIVTWMLWVPFVIWGIYWVLGVYAEPSECQPAPIGC